MEEKQKSLRESAKEYEPKKTKNIADMDVVILDDCAFAHRTNVNAEGEEYSFDAVVYKGEDYRVPATVMANLKAILEVKPNLKSIKVLKSGKGLETKYQVIPLD